MIVAPATSEGGWGGKYTVANMLAEKQLWLTKEIPSRQVESAITTGRLAQEVCVEEVAADGHRRRDAHRVELLRDVQGGGGKPSHYPPTTIAVETTATRFKVSVSQPEVW
jgi:hypothetical protein